MIYARYTAVSRVGMHNSHNIIRDRSYTCRGIFSPFRAFIAKVRFVGVKKLVYQTNCKKKMFHVIRRKAYKENVLYFKRLDLISAEMQSTLSIKDMPHYKGLPLIGTKVDVIRMGGGYKLHEYIDHRHKQLGPIFNEKLGGDTKLVFISDPVLMKTLFMNLEGKYPTHILPEPWVLYEKLYGSKRGLFFMDGEEWLSNRRIMNKHVLREGVEKWLQEPINSTIQNFVQTWKKKAETKNFIPNLEFDLYRLSTDVIINILLGTGSISQSRYYDELLNIFSESVKRIFQTTTKLYGLPVSWYQRLNLKPWREFKECVDLSICLAQKIVQEMVKNKQKNNGLIQKLSQENMSDETITRIVADFVIAAGDTTAYTTLWILWLLSKHDNVRDEIRAKNMTYVKHVIKESMRLYPVAPFLTRILLNESTLGPYTIKEGTPIIASIYTSGRDENNFSQAEQFLPYRWDKNDPRKCGLPNHVPSATLPFALGARSCIGKKIAMLQLTEMTKQIVDNFEFSCKNNSVINAITSQVLIPNQDIQLLFTLRPKCGNNKNNSLTI